jgi:hypothetical protein
MPIATIANETKSNTGLTKPWHLAGIFGFAFLFLMLTMNMFVKIYDEGVILFDSVRILSGDVPYRDFYANYGPAQFYVLAALFKILGPSVMVERMWDIIIRSSTILIIYLIINSAWSRRTALLTALVAALWLTSFATYGYPAFPCLFFSLLSLYCTLLVLNGRRESTFLLASGACIGIVALFRHDVGVLATVGGLFTLGFFHLTQNYDTQHKRKAFVRSAATYICGILLVSVPALLLLLSAVSMHDILLNLVYLPATTYVRFRSLPFPSIAGILSDAIHMKTASLVELIVYLPILGALVGGVAAFSFGTKRVFADTDSIRGRELILQRRWILVQLSAFSALFFLRGFVRVSVVHMSLAIIPALMIVCMTIAQWRLLRYKAAAVLLWLAFACLIISSLPMVLQTGMIFAENIAWAKASVGNPPLASSFFNSVYPPIGLERIRFFWLDPNQINAIIYVQERTKANDYIYVGTNRHDMIFVNDNLFYFASKRLSATKWHQFDPGIQTTKDIQTEIISDLRMRTPRFVILLSFRDKHEPNESAWSSGVSLLDDFLKVNYKFVAFFGAWRIYEITTDSPL